MVHSKIAALLKLKELNLSDNSLESLPIEITKLSSLETFDLSKNPFKMPSNEVINSLEKSQTFRQKQKLWKN